MRKRNHAIDVLKFVATLAIFNHLAAPFYGRYAMLATGGAIGCVLFFFCSGYLIASAGGGISFHGSSEGYAAFGRHVSLRCCFTRLFAGCILRNLAEVLHTRSKVPGGSCRALWFIMWHGGGYASRRE